MLAYNEVEGASDLGLLLERGCRGRPTGLVVDDASLTAPPRPSVPTAHDEHAVVVSLSRNFGSHAARSAGLKECRATLPRVRARTGRSRSPRWSTSIGENRMAPTSCGLRSTRAARRQEALPRGSLGLLQDPFRCAHIPLAVDRRVINVLNHMPEANRNLLAMVAWLGFDQRRIYFEQCCLGPTGPASGPREKKINFWSSTRSCIFFPLRQSRWISRHWARLGCAWLGAPWWRWWPHSLVLVPVGFTVLAGLVIGLPPRVVTRTPHVLA